MEIPRVSKASPRAKNRTLGQASLPRVLLSGKNCTRGRGFPECRSLPGTRGRMTLEKSPLPRAQQSGKRRTRGRKVFLDVPDRRRRWSLKWKKFFPERKKNSRGRRPFPSAKAWHSGKILASPSAAVQALGEEALPRELRKALGEVFSFFSFFLPHFFWCLPTLFQTSCLNLEIFKLL
jgi:hypothetical protein